MFRSIFLRFIVKETILEVSYLLNVALKYYICIIIYEKKLLQ
jgi:hypothetical protein